MATCIQVTGSMERRMVKGLLIMQMVHIIREIGRMMCIMASELKLGLKVINSRVNLKRG